MRRSEIRHEFGGSRRWRSLPRVDGSGEHPKVVCRGGVWVGEGRVTLGATRPRCPQTPSRPVGRGGSRPPINLPPLTFSQDTPFSGSPRPWCLIFVLSRPFSKLLSERHTQLTPPFPLLSGSDGRNDHWGLGLYQPVKPTKEGPVCPPLCAPSGMGPGMGWHEWALQVRGNRDPLEPLRMQFTGRTRGAVTEAGTSGDPRESCLFCVQCRGTPELHRPAAPPGPLWLLLPCRPAFPRHTSPKLGARGCPWSPLTPSPAPRLPPLLLWPVLVAQFSDCPRAPCGPLPASVDRTCEWGGRSHP